MFKFVKTVRSAALVAGSALVASAHAALPAGAETAITAVGTDVVQAVGLVITAGIAIYAAKKLGQKMGWL
jgi:diphthamide biosynthesis methyltransferase